MTSSHHHCTNKAVMINNTPSSTFQNYDDTTTFPFRLYDMLEAAEPNKFDHIVCWVFHGRSFKVHDSKEFEERILPEYFSGQSKYKSFLRQLNFYKFKRTTDGNDKGKKATSSFFAITMHENLVLLGTAMLSYYC